MLRRYFPDFGCCDRLRLQKEIMTGEMEKGNNQMNKYSQLFSPLKVGNLTLRNRIMTGPMSIVELDAKEGLTERAISYYESLAAGGAAVVTLGVYHSDGLRQDP